MNQKEWKILSKQKKENRPKNLFYYRNLAEKILGYKRNSGLVIHHLRNTEKERNFNDMYYERWGIDFDGKLKYTILITIEEHKLLHSVSKETKEKISKSVSVAKTKYTKEEVKQHKLEADRKSRNKKPEFYKKQKKEYYNKNKQHICEMAKKYRDTHKEYIAQKKKEWKQKNREYVNKKKREYYARKKNM